MVSKRLAHSPHVSCFSFSIYIFFLLPSLHPFHRASGFHYHPHSLHFYASTFLLPHFHPPNLLSHRYSQKSLFQTPLSSRLSLCLAAAPPAPSSALPLTSCSCFLPSPCQPHTTTTPLSMEMFLCFFPPLKPLPDCSSKKVPAAQIIPFKLSKDKGQSKSSRLQSTRSSFLTCP